MSFWGKMFGTKHKPTPPSPVAEAQKEFYEKLGESHRLAERARTSAEEGTRRARQTAVEALKLLRGVKNAERVREGHGGQEKI